MSQMLIQEPPLQVLPSLAVAIGLNEAIILQQLHYWLQKSQHTHDGKPWVYNTYEGWQANFPFWSIPTIKRAIAKLEKTELIISTDEYNHHKVDRTKWYTINYDHLILTARMIRPSDQNDPSNGSKRSAPSDQNDPLYIEQRLQQETTAETNSPREDDPKLAWLDRTFEPFYFLYPRKEGKKDAHKAWRQLSPNAIAVQKIGEALEAQINNNWEGREKQYIPLPASWIRGKRWTDEIITPKQNGKSARGMPLKDRNGNYTAEGLAELARQLEAEGK